MESESESLNMDFIDDGHIENVSTLKQTPKSVILNDLNKFNIILADTTKPSQALEIFEELIKINAKAKNYFTELPYSFCQCVLDLFNTQFDEAIFNQKLQRKAKQKFDQLLVDYAFLKDNAIQQQSNTQIQAQTEQISKRDDDLDINRIYSFFGISFQESDEIISEQTQMDEQQSIQQIQSSCLTIYQQAFNIMTYSQSPSCRAHAALSYLEGTQNETHDILPTLSFAFREIFENSLQEQSFTVQKKKEVRTYYNRLLDVGAHLSQFCDCLNHLIIILYLNSSEYLQLVYIPGFIRSLADQTEISDNFIFSEPEHCEVSYKESILLSNYSYYNNDFNQQFNEFLAISPLLFVTEAISKLNFKTNKVPFLYAALTYITHATLQQTEEFMSLYYFPTPVQQVQKVVEVAKKSNILPLTINMEEEIVEEITLTDIQKLYFTVLARLAIKQINLLNTKKAALNITKILSFDGTFDNKFITKFSPKNINSLLFSAIALRVLDVKISDFYGDQNLKDGNTENDWGIIKKVVDGGQEVEVKVLRAFINMEYIGQNREMDQNNIFSEIPCFDILKPAFDGMSARVFLMENTGILSEISVDGVISFFGVSQQVAQAVLQRIQE
ncbi:hypothetical protein SS50377_28155 [Spironucleus salmonicida]|uniref:Uncharacterized protein n=1 Tax=Spironucleus salmonicida TaxID=348837 RepID=V6LSR1_9EUKA|nr:hypothetical protein SS50377_28155 [Spironucleus salmonicida]|eukprot:EST47667.1 Hypothetical protein SS50377_12253 [Spironucleus salmonicida]